MNSFYYFILYMCKCMYFTCNILLSKAAAFYIKYVYIYITQ